MNYKVIDIFKKYFKFVEAAAFLVLLLLCIKFYSQLNLLQHSSPQATNQQQEIKQLTDKVSRFMILPTDEAPVIATVNDAAALAAEQPFYKNAVNGDKLLIYSAAEKAILYSPSRNIIVNAGPFVSSASNINQKGSSQNSQTKPPSPAPSSTSKTKK